MINKEEFRAKAQFFRLFNNLSLKAGVTDTDRFTDFSPKSII